MPGTDPEFNNRHFQIQQLLSRVETTTLVKIMAVTNDGGLAPVGFVDALPLVNQTDGAGTSVPHETIYHLPYCRIQGGANAVILDPQVGDIGLAGFASRDISSVKANKGQSNPGSRRRHDPADGVYICGCLNQAPTQYIQFNSDGITLVSPTKITISAPILNIDADTVAITGAQITHNGHQIGDVHRHTQTQPGSGNSGPPQ